MPDTDVISEDDSQLAVFLEEKNQQSMDYFYDKYSPALYGIIYRITDNRGLAEECLTATFVKAWNQSSNYTRGGTSIFTWLINLARQSAFKVMAREAETNPGEQNSVYGRDQQFSAFELVYFKGLSILQAAELSGISITELTTNLRTDLHNMKEKKQMHDQ